MHDYVMFLIHDNFFIIKAAITNNPLLKLCYSTFKINYHQNRYAGIMHLS